jgi:hypothetical protein
MAHTAKHLVLTLAAAALLSAPFADAAKFGGGKSSGMQRSTPSKSQSYNSTPAQQAPAPSTEEKMIRAFFMADSSITQISMRGKELL